MNQIPILPRRDLREPAFLRFRHIIERAARTDVLHLDPSELLGKNPDTFCARFSDARLGLVTYNYPCNLPEGFNPRLLRAFPLGNGGVMIQNRGFIPVAAQRSSELIEGKTLDEVKALIANTAAKPNQRLSFKIAGGVTEPFLNAEISLHSTLYTTDSDHPNSVTIVSFAAEKPVDFSGLTDQPDQSDPVARVLGS